MINQILNLWKQLPPEVQAILTWLFDKQLGAVIGLLALLSGWRLRHKLLDAIHRFRIRRNLEKRLPDFAAQEIKRGIRYYIWPKCQSVDPSQSDEARQTVAVRHDLCSTMDELLKQDTIHKHFILLADSGMGKTSFLLNYFARHLRRWRKPFEMALIPLGVPELEQRLKKIDSPEKTVLLLDAFDEDTAAIHDHTQRLGQMMDWTRRFSRVVITCRTQFFPRDEEIPIETGIVKVGPRQAGEGPQFTFTKLYLSPFSDEQIEAYLKRRFPFWRRNRRSQARAIVGKIPNLAVRPMLLTYVDDLIGSGETFTNSYQIYAKMVDAWLERERKKVADKQALREFSNKLAVELFVNREQRGSERIPYEEIETLAEQYKIELASWQLTGRSLLNRDAEGNYKFAHRSILEFLFAERILEGEQIAINVAQKLWTEQVISFISEGLNKLKKINDQLWNSFIPLVRSSKLDSKLLAKYNVFVRFQGGSFKMGGSEKIVEIEPFEIATHPVTNREYEEFDPSHRELLNKYSNHDDQPVVNVSWEDAVQYCQWLSKKTDEHYRLPTEAEWEFAASGGGKRRYPWGDEAATPERANYNESKISKTTPVGSYPLGMTPEGLFDMAGNVWEWCADWWDEKKE